MSTFPPTPEELNDWDKVTAAFDNEFPAPRLDFDWEGDLNRTVWIFRGHKKLSYPLQPSIERAAERRPDSWAVLEDIIVDEFQSKARLHVDARDLPPLDERLSWLALMQHYRVPTRLLDFTYSPYVALYFALRNRSQEERKEPAGVWAIYASALLERAVRVSRKADVEQMEYEAHMKGVSPPRHSGRVSGHPASSGTDRRTLRQNQGYWRQTVEKALIADEARRVYFGDKGFVAFALPPIQNQRLSNQQGAFLFNAAESLTFAESLSRFMEDHSDRWCRLFSIPADAAQEYERKLFQMNIHDLSLFPDMEGLAGFIRQKTQLHWLVPD